MDMLSVESVENGFVVYENRLEGELGKKWAFENALTLAHFIEDWGNGQTKTTGGFALKNEG